MTPIKILFSFFYCVSILRILIIIGPPTSSRSRTEQSLVRWASPQLHDIDLLSKMVDPALNGMYPAKSLSRFADIIALCVQVRYPILSQFFFFWERFSVPALKTSERISDEIRIIITLDLTMEYSVINCAAFTWISAAHVRSGSAACSAGATCQCCPETLGWRSRLLLQSSRARTICTRELLLRQICTFHL